MHSEYDFLFSHSRRLRRIGRVLAAAGAVLVGAAAMALVIGLPLQSRSGVQTTVSSAESSLGRGSSQMTAPKAADTAVETRASGVRAAVVALNENQAAAANAPSQTPTALKEKSRPKTGLSRLELASAYEPSGPAPAPAPAQPATTASVPSLKLPSGSVTQPTGVPTQPAATATQPAVAATQPTGAATQPRSVVRRPKTETAANAPQPMPDRIAPEPGRVRPEPFSIKEFLASHP
jgi:hypothetical protein